MTYNQLLDNLLIDLGGCGLYQWLLALIVQVGKITATWSMITMSFAGQNPGFTCRLGDSGNGSMFDKETGNFSLVDKCNVNGTQCQEYIYDDRMQTVASEFDLICGKKWIPATITTIQMGGVLLGCSISGHMADLIGRKPTYFAGVFSIAVTNLVGYFATSWVFYAAVRFLIGIGVGFYLTVQYSITNEFTTSRWRPVVVTAPAWAIQSGLFALASWGFHDWKKLHLAIAILGAPFMLAWWLMPESFRWLVTKEKFDDAENVISAIARVNQKDKPDLTKIFEAAKESQANEEAMSARKKHYSVVDLFKTWESARLTVGLLFAWFAASYGYYGITFGVKSLSGDLYLNMFLINIIEAPVMLLTAALVSWIGRKKVAFTFYVLAGVTGIAVGVIQYTDAPVNGVFTNVIALFSKLSVACGWQAMIVYTTELYPTVVRTIAYGAHSTAARVGGMVAPQIVFLDDEIPGILYFLSGVLMMISAVIMMLYRETKDAVLGDTLDDEVKIPVDIKKDISIIDSDTKL
ncbi:hypothetical protein ACF0H5_001462 [Mactra antiquata]